MIPARLSHWPAATDEPILETTVGSVLRAAASDAPDRIALVMGTNDPDHRPRWTYGDMLARAEKTARALLARFSPGSRIGIWAPNVAEFFDIEFGVALAGMTLVPLNPAFQLEEARHPLLTSRARGLFYWPRHRTNEIEVHAQRLAGELPDLQAAIPMEDLAAFLAGADDSLALPAVDAGSAAQIQFTSGTTGPPKGVIFHHRGMTNMARFACQRMGVGPDAVWVNPNPMFHASGCALSTIGPLTVRATQVCLEQFSPGLLLELLESERGTMTGGVPTMLLSMMEDPDFSKRDLSSLRTVMSGGSVVPPELVRRIENAFGAHFAVAFGQTETLGNITQTRLDDTPEDKAETIGQAFPQTELKIIAIGDPAGVVVPIGVAGELCVRSPIMMEEYCEAPGLTAETIDADGWLHTGDVCVMDSRGYFRVSGRLKDIIIRGGENIAAREIEDALFRHPAVAEAAVVGVPDTKWGEQVMAFVRLASDQSISTDELDAHLRAGLAAFKVPRYWMFVESFPLSAGGKIQKNVLRARAASLVSETVDPV